MLSELPHEVRFVIRRRQWIAFGIGLLIACGLIIYSIHRINQGDRHAWSLLAVNLVMILYHVVWRVYMGAPPTKFLRQAYKEASCGNLVKTEQLLHEAVKRSS